ncbi:hypothetical protein A6301_04245 [Pectobacterium sp. IFB5596]|nr:hypothetical protein [Pectobacterium sp. IFB5596]
MLLLVARLLARLVLLVLVLVLVLRLVPQLRLALRLAPPHWLRWVSLLLLLWVLLLLLPAMTIAILRQQLLGPDVSLIPRPLRWPFFFWATLFNENFIA